MKQFFFVLLMISFVALAQSPRPPSLGWTDAMLFYVCQNGETASYGVWTSNLSYTRQYGAVYDPIERAENLHGTTIYSSSPHDIAQLEIANQSLLRFASNQNFTVAAWVKMTGGPAGLGVCPTSYGRVIGDQSGWGWNLTVGTNVATFGYYWDAISGGSAHFTGVSNLNRWVFVAGIKTGSVVTCWYNGQKTNAVLPSANIHHVGEYKIGIQQCGVHWYGLPAKVSHIAVWPRALSDEEIMQLYSEGRE